MNRVKPRRSRQQSIEIHLGGLTDLGAAPLPADRIYPKPHHRRPRGTPMQVMTEWMTKA